MTFVQSGISIEEHIVANIVNLAVVILTGFQGDIVERDAATGSRRAAVEPDDAIASRSASDVGEPDVGPFKQTSISAFASVGNEVCQTGCQPSSPGKLCNRPTRSAERLDADSPR
jgi:hypothetical protein